MRRAAAAVAGAALLGAPTAFAQERAALPDPSARLSAAPPLGSDAQPLAGAAFTTGMRAAEEVRVGVDALGRPHSVEVLQRLELTGSGDYAFVVPAPLVDVRPGPATQSRPGFRRGAIVWQGFSPGRRRLAAVAVLEAAAARPYLPLDVSVWATAGGERVVEGERRSGDLALRVEIANRTEVSVTSFGGRGQPAELARVLDQTRRRLAAGNPLLPELVRARDVARATYRVDVGFRVSGTITLPAGRFTTVRASGARTWVDGRSVRFRATLGAGRPPKVVVNARGRLAGGVPRLELRAEPLRDVPGLRPPAGRDWTAALRAGVVRPNPRRFLATAVTAFLRLARLAQYDAFLRNPHPSAGLGQTRTAYVYRTVARPAAVPAAGGDGSGSSAFAVLVAAGVLVGLAAAVVVWAHS